jgi:hypothetical protein
MPGICVLGDICTGHRGCRRPRPNIQASTTIFVCGRGAHRVGDMWATHCRHSGILVMGSTNIFAENRGVGRCRDPINCGSRVMTCVSNVFANGS